MNILVSIEELRIGGAQVFALRFAQALHEAGHRVYLYTLYWQLTEHELVRRLAPDVPVLAYQPRAGQHGLDLLLQRAEGWWQRKGLRGSVRRNTLRRHLAQVIRDKHIEVVSSNTVKSDHLAALALAEHPRVPLVVTMHGDYEQFLAFYRSGKDYIIPGYLDLLADTLARLNGVAYLSEQNLETLQPGVVPALPPRSIIRRRIYNGLDGRPSAEAARFTRSALGVAPDALVFGMVARGVPEKGWQPVIDAFQRLRAEVPRSTYLLLVGESPYLSRLQEQYCDDDSLRFLGFVNNPVDCVASFDVGILASSLKESLPNCIAEYLFCGKAVISTEIGEIRNMVRTDDGQEAGILVDFPNNGLTNSALLYQAMHRYATEPALLAQHQQLAHQAFKKFDMHRCVQSYTDLYNECRQQLASAQ